MLISGMLLLSQVIYIGFFYLSLPPFLPLFNQLSWGEERLGTKIEIFLPVVIAILFLLFNFFLLNYLYEKMPLVARILGITTLLIAIISFIFILQTLHLIL
jgi:hypothetical protein